MVPIVLAAVVARPAAASDQDRLSTQRPGWLGLGLSYHEAPKENGGVDSWLFVRVVDERGPSGDAGVRLQDLITEIDGESFSFEDGLELLQFFGSIRQGQVVELKIKRVTGERIVKVKAGEMPEDVFEAWSMILNQERQEHEAIREQ